MIPTSMDAFAANHGERGAAWVARLPELIASYGARWDLSLRGPLPGSGSAAWVGEATRRSDRADVVLKIGWPHPEAATEPAGLRFFDGQGAVRLLEADEDEFALLLERCRPGDAVWSLAVDEANSIAARVLRRLWRTPTGPVAPITTLAATVDEWHAAYATSRAEYPRALVADAVDVGLRLVTSTAQLVVVHGDFNPFNILRAQREPWLAIDPKPLVGDPAYDLAQYLANYLEVADDSGDPKRFFHHAIGLFARDLGLDRYRIAAWMFVKSIGWTWGPRAARLFKEVADDER